MPSLSRDGTALHDLDSEEEIYNELVPFIHTLYFKVILYYTSRPLCLGFNLIQIRIMDSKKNGFIKDLQIFFPKEKIKYFSSFLCLFLCRNLINQLEIRKFFIR